MPLMHVLDTPSMFVIQQCANCGHVHSIPFSSLKLGNETETDIIEFPACSCGAMEFLNRTFDTVPDNLADHRKKVNALADALKKAGQMHPKSKAKIEAEKKTPTQVGDLVGPVNKIHGLPDPVFPAGLKLPGIL
jgi:hypothetical protein